MSEARSPLVSIPVVTYRHGEFIEECLEAILAQEYPNLQIIVADDASDDGAQEIISDVAARHPGQLTVLNTRRNLGVQANHQRALDACEGEYIAWMSGDDLMLPGKIRAQVELMEADRACAICYHDVDLFDSASGRSLRRYSDTDTPREGGIGMLARFGAFNAATANMVRADVAPAFDARVPVASDWLWYTECLAGGGTIRYLPRLLGRYRRHAGNVTGSGTPFLAPRIFDDHLKSVDILAERYPALRRDLDYRASRLLAGQRWADEGARYDECLRASLKRRFSIDIFAALVASRLLGIRR